MNYPTMANPLKLTCFNPDSQQIPALKNRRRPYIGTNKKTGQKYAGITKDPEVQLFEKVMLSQYTSQFLASGFDTIAMPTRVGVICLVYKYHSKEGFVPVSDLDNQYTTLQEGLASANIIENDRQIAAFLPVEVPCYLQSAQHAKLLLLALDNSTDYGVQLMELYAQHISQEKKPKNAFLLPDIEDF